METPAETFTRDEFSLTRWQSADCAAVAAAVAGSGAHLADWVPWAMDGYTASDAADFLRLTHENWETGRAYEWAIRAGAALAGGVGVMTRDGGVEIGYWLAREFTGRGLVTRAVSLLVSDVFARGAGYVEIKHDEANVRSGAIPARLGFSLVGKEPRPDAVRPPSCAGTHHVWRLERP
ncbi:Protein N-acetyltransferase, RimJ/RimL family [Amycolatopsis pretoriensis]|uniref:Protein N-acetyltransferase, RimJ/RimL family n=1 Tax=Amycolatopsis pretoriensis TaxID=218821 RepID=A0A1H5RJ13_9PSEU|nr:GNAT family N-acetyltransferase [Amycolatopsis pretoriensis]SEF37708.1 Protein N-acetyltransferase, RimJ/RimL family [Amycolatopsis pretoriensis]